MNFPPLPPIPPASEISRYSSLPPDSMSPITQYEADEDARELVFDIYQDTPIDERVYLLTQALHIFPFSVDAYANWGYIYRCMVTPKQPQKAKEAYERAVKCAKLLWPELERQETIEWGYVEHRPYLRAVSGLAFANQDLGDMDEAIKGFKYLLRVNPNDNQGIRHCLFFALLETGDYTLAEQFFREQEDKSADLLYGKVLLAFRKFKRDETREERVQKNLVAAIMANTYVPDMLLNLKDGDEMPPTPPTYSPGGRTGALMVINRIGKAWKSTPGLQDWFRSQVKLGGSKPNDDGTILFEMLQEGSVLVVINSDEVGKKAFDLTTNVANIPGRGLPEFYLAPGMKTHDPQKIVAFDNRKGWEDRDIPWLQRYVSFSYDEVESMPFWKLLKAHQPSRAEKEDHYCNVCYEAATLKCGSCSVTWYCSKKCQVDDWKGRGESFQHGLKLNHKIMCKKFEKT